jgi:Protein of unknown function (DUF1524)
MRMHPDQQESLYITYWAPLQEKLGDDLTECIRHFLMKDGAVVKQGEVFLTLKERADDKSQDQVINYLKEVAEFAGYYDKFLHPKSENREEVRKRLERLSRLEVTTAYPFLLNVYHDYSKGIIKEHQFVEVLDTLENFILRRFVCGIPTNTLNKIFPPLYSQSIQQGDLVNGLKAVLATKNYPRDLEFRNKFASTRFYGGDRAAKCKLILEKLELSYGHHEKVDLSDTTIEHVMPQTLTDWWKLHIGVDWEFVHDSNIHTIGNLTLSGYNPHLSNADFPSKKTILNGSHLELNKHFASIEVWNEDAIIARAEHLAIMASQVWKYFGPKQNEPEEIVVPDIEQGPSVEGFDLPTVLARLGGGTNRSNDSRLSIFDLDDGRTIIIKYSKLYSKNNYYWYGIRPKVFDDFATLAITHVAFVMGSLGICTIPVEILQCYRTQTKASFNPDGSIRHYHILISNESIPILYWSSETSRYSLENYFQRL